MEQSIDRVGQITILFVKQVVFMSKYIVDMNPGEVFNSDEV